MWKERLKRLGAWLNAWANPVPLISEAEFEKRVDAAEAERVRPVVLDVSPHDTARPMVKVDGLPRRPAIDRVRLDALPPEATKPATKVAKKKAPAKKRR